MIHNSICLCTCSLFLDKASRNAFSCPGLFTQPSFDSDEHWALYNPVCKSETKREGRHRPQDLRTITNVDTQPEFISSGRVSPSSGEREEWKLATSGTKRKSLAPPKGLQLQSKFTALKAEEKPDGLSSKVSGPVNPEPCGSYIFSLNFSGNRIRVEEAKVKS